MKVPFSSLKVIHDCLNFLCERVAIPNGLEYDEYSIFIISSSGEKIFFEDDHT